jgi:curli biogenesis system outer membrane secretion channel CsgG
MRRIWLFTVFIILLILACGCTQKPAAPTIPTPAQPVTTTVPATTADTQKQISVIAYKTDNSVVLKYIGGRDAPTLTAFKVQIDNQDGSNIKQTIYAPVVGNDYAFQYMGIPNPVTINVVGVFSDGTEQTVLIQYF